MGYAIIVILCKKRCHRDNILRIVVLNRTQIAKFSFTCSLLRYDVRNLYVDTLSFRLRAYKVYLTSLQLSYIDLKTKSDEMFIYNILYNLLNISFPCTTSYGISYAIVLKVKLIIVLKDALTVYVISVNLMQDVCFA